MRVNLELGESHSLLLVLLLAFADLEIAFTSFPSKDREILRGDPHKLIEGCLVAGRAMNASAGQSLSLLVSRAASNFD